MQRVYVVHYHEIALKGRNRPMFLKQLQENICRTAGLGKGSVKIMAGRLIVHYPSPQSLPTGQAGSPTRGEEEKHNPSPLMGEGRVRVALSRTFGISSFSPAVLVKAEYGEIEKAVREMGRNPLQLPLNLRGSENWTFAIRATRGDKQFSITSKELEVKLGDFVRTEFSKKVDLEKPDVTFYVEVFSARGGSPAGRPGGAVVYTEKIPGPGGLPVGTQPKVAVLLSGGIDSPVAAYRIMKRGAPLLAVHFHSYPFTSRASIDKVKELAGVLGQYHGGRPISLYLVPLAEAQKAVVQNCSEKYRVLLYRRLMLRIAEEIVRKENAQALVTGESLGQVASQTVDNLAVVEAALRTPHPNPLPQGEREIKGNSPPLVGWVRGGCRAPLPIFRPLIGYDKEEIITEAKRLGTYDISIQPHDDCCSLFMPKQVATRARLLDLNREENKLDIARLVQNALNQTAAA